MALIDELEGVFGKETLAKLPAELRAKVEFGEELTKYYDGAVEEAPVRKPARAAETVVASVVTAPGAAAPGSLSAGLDDIAKLLDTRLDTLKTGIKTEFETTMKTEGDKLFNSAVARSIKLTDELADVRETHRSTFNEKLDTVAFDKFINDNGGMGQFKSIDGAYKSFMGDRLVQKKIDDGVRDGLKQRNSGAALPGVSPNGSKGPVSILSARRRDGTTPSADAPKSNIEKAADALAARLAVNE